MIGEALMKLSELLPDGLWPGAKQESLFQMIFF